MGQCSTQRFDVERQANANPAVADPSHEAKQATGPDNAFDDAGQEQPKGKLKENQSSGPGLWEEA